MTWLETYTKNKRLFFFLALALLTLGQAYYGCISYMVVPASNWVAIGMAPGIVFLIFFEIVCLFLLALILAERGETPAALGFSLKVSDFWHSVVLFLGALILGAIPMWFYFFVKILAGASPSSIMDLNTGKVLMDAFSKMPIWLLLIFICVNPIFEESIVRAYFMTETNHFLKKAWLTVLLSALVQAGYHLYQGWVPTIDHFFTFLIFSIYYQKTKRATPIVFAHFYMDAIPILGAPLFAALTDKYLGMFK